MPSQLSQGNHSALLQAELADKDILDLVRHTRLQTGKIIITLHNGDATKVAVQCRAQLLLRQGKAASNAILSTSIQLDGLERLVLSRFENPIRTQVGPFGGLRIKVVNGRLVNWGFFVSHK